MLKGEKRRVICAKVVGATSSEGFVVKFIQREESQWFPDMTYA